MNKEVLENQTIYNNDRDITYNVNKKAKLTIFNFNWDSDSSATINLNVPGSEVEYHYSTFNLDNHNFTITINHNSSKTNSNIYAHGINAKGSRLSFDITGIVPKTSVDCICNEENIIINLQEGKSEIKPNLLIDNYNVNSSHSAYIGKFKEEEIFYLMSRGMSSEKTMNILMTGLLLNGADKEKVNEFFDNLQEVQNG